MLRMPGAHCSGNVEDCRLQHSKYGLFTTVLTALTRRRKLLSRMTYHLMWMHIGTQTCHTATLFQDENQVLSPKRESSTNPHYQAQGRGGRRAVRPKRKGGPQDKSALRTQDWCTQEFPDTAGTHTGPAWVQARHSPSTKRESSRLGLPPLTIVLSTIGTHLQGKSESSPMASHRVYQPHFKIGPQANAKLIRWYWCRVLCLILLCWEIFVLLVFC